MLVSRHWHCPVHEKTMGYGNENRGELGSSSRSTPTKLNENCGILGTKMADITEYSASNSNKGMQKTKDELGLGSSPN